MEKQTYPARLGMPILPINQIKKIIFEDIRRSVENDMLTDDKKQCFHIVGPAGIGKTQITFQIAEELSDYFKDKKFNVIRITAPVLSRDDFLMPYPVGKDKFKMLYSDYVPDESMEYGLFVIDEASRGDQQLQQMLWQIQNECGLHTHKFPKGWFVIVLDNPDDDNYQVNFIEDAAGLRRCLHFYTKVSTKVFLNYALSNNFNEHVINYLKNYPEKLYDFNGQQEGKIFANPASWERISNHLFKYKDDIPDNISIIECLCAGLLNIYEAKLFCDYLKDVNGVIIKPADIYSKYPKVRNYILKYVQNNKNDKLFEILKNLINYLCDEQPAPLAKNIKNMLTFLTDIPSDIAAGFVTCLQNLEIGSKEHLYIMGLLVAMNTESEDFKKNFFDKLINLSS